MIKTLAVVIAWLFTLPALPAGGVPSKPLRLHPENPHYLIFRGKPTVLVSSGEHYGAVLNQDFDFLTYLDTLKAEGMNLTRTVPGTSLESTNARTYRGGDQNTFAPRPGRFLAPWARSDRPGYFYGGNKFDLDRWDEAFFKRLKHFVSAASERGIVVEFNLFYVLYGDGPEFGKWNLHPLNARNNVNNVGHVPFHRYNTLDEPGLVARQEAVLRKLLTELNWFDNVYYEICDEPYCSGASPKETGAWQNHLLEVARATMRKLPNRQLLAVNYANEYTLVKKPHPAVSLLNFHYCYPPAVVPLNWPLNKPICFDETGGGHQILERRREAWAFMLSGGAVYNNLDPSFATDDPTGSGKIQQPDGRFDGRALRKQLRTLREFMESLDFIHMQPDRSAAAIPPHPGARATRWSNPGNRLRFIFIRRVRNRAPECCWICQKAAGAPTGCTPPPGSGSPPKSSITPEAAYRCMGPRSLMTLQYACSAPAWANKTRVRNCGPAPGVFGRCPRFSLAPRGTSGGLG